MPLADKTKKRLSQAIPSVLFLVLVLAGTAGIVSLTVHDPILDRMVRKAGARIVNTDIDSTKMDYRLEKIPKGQTSLSEFDSGVVLINFWGTYCRPCVDELPSLVRLAEHFSNTGLRIVAVSYDKSRGKIARFMRNTIPGPIPGNFIVLLDPSETETDLKSMFGTEKIPETYVVVNNVIRARFLGPVDWDRPEIITMLNYLLGKTG